MKQAGDAYEPRFLLTGARVRFNPTPEADTGIGTQVDDDGTTVAWGMLNFSEGWTPETAQVMGCLFEKDESLPQGTLVIEPLGEDIFRSSDAKPSDEHTQREPAEDATSGTAGPGLAPD